MLRIAICDSDKKQQTELLNFIAEDVDIDDDYTTECFDSIADAKTRMDRNDFNFDLLFLGIDEDGVDGLHLAEHLRERKFDIDVIFLAKTVEFITEAFRCKAFNYIVKPITFSKFSYEMKQYLKEKNNYQKEYLSVSIQGKEQMIPLNAVLYFTSNARKVGAFFSNNDKEIWFYGKLDELENSLEKYGYIRCHQSYLVSGHKIESVNGDVIKTSQASFPISRKYSENVKNKWEKVKKKRFDVANLMAINRMVENNAVGEEDETYAGNTSVISTKSYAPGATKYGIIVGIRGPRQNVSFRLYHEEEAILGRDSKQCQIVINDGAISRKHCGVKFDVEQQCYWVCDYSKNGTLIGMKGRMEKERWIRVEKDTLIQLVNEKCAFILV